MTVYLAPNPPLHPLIDARNSQGRKHKTKKDSIKEQVKSEIRTTQRYSRWRDLQKEMKNLEVELQLADNTNELEKESERLVVAATTYIEEKYKEKHKSKEFTKRRQEIENHNKQVKSIVSAKAITSAKTRCQAAAILPVQRGPRYKILFEQLNKTFSNLDLSNNKVEDVDHVKKYFELIEKKLNGLVTKLNESLDPENLQVDLKVYLDSYEKKLQDNAISSAKKLVGKSEITALQKALLEVIDSEKTYNISLKKWHRALLKLIEKNDNNQQSYEKLNENLAELIAASDMILQQYKTTNEDRSLKDLTSATVDVFNLEKLAQCFLAFSKYNYSFDSETIPTIKLLYQNKETSLQINSVFEEVEFEFEFEEETRVAEEAMVKEQHKFEAKTTVTHEASAPGSSSGSAETVTSPLLSDNTEKIAVATESQPNPFIAFMINHPAATGAIIGALVIGTLVVASVFTFGAAAAVAATAGAAVGLSGGAAMTTGTAMSFFAGATVGTTLGFASGAVIGKLSSNEEHEQEAISANI